MPPFRGPTVAAGARSTCDRHPVRRWCLRRGARPPASRSRRARTSATSITTASPGSRSHRKVTTQSAQADVPSMTHSSQLMYSELSPMPVNLCRRCDIAFGDLLDPSRRPTPPALDRFDPLVQHLEILDRQLAPHRVVVERALTASDRDVEASEVAARRAAIPGGRARHAAQARRTGAGAAGPGAPPEAPGPAPPEDHRGTV